MALGAPYSAGDLQRTRDLARRLTEIERGQVADIPERSAGGAVVGLVGPPGVGKSSIISALTTRARARQESVVVLAVDPTSPISGGAILGDRVRMASHGDDPQTFIRSFASRTHPGGLAAAIPAAVAAAIELGWNRVFVEPVGGGQNDVDVAACSDVVLLVISPESGDDVQALKAGILELADIVVVNKADRGGAGSLMRALRSSGSAASTRPCLAISTIDGSGLDELDAAVLEPRPEYASRRDGALWNSVMNDLVSVVAEQLKAGAAGGDVLDLARRGQRREAVRRVMKELCDD